MNLKSTQEKCSKNCCCFLTNIKMLPMDKVLYRFFKGYSNKFEKCRSYNVETDFKVWQIPPPQTHTQSCIGLL